MAHKIGDRTFFEGLVDLFKPYMEEWIREHGARVVLGLPGLASALLWARKQMGRERFGQALMLGTGYAHIGELDAVRDWMGHDRNKNKIVGLADEIVDKLGPALRRWGEGVTDAELEELLHRAPHSPLVEWVRRVTGIGGEVSIMKTAAVVDMRDARSPVAYHPRCVHVPHEIEEVVEGRVTTRVIVRTDLREAHHPSCVHAPEVRGGRDRDPNVRTMPYADIAGQGIDMAACCHRLIEQEKQTVKPKRRVKNSALREGVPYESLGSQGIRIHCDGCEALWAAEEKEHGHGGGKTFVGLCTELGIAEREAGGRLMNLYLRLEPADQELVQEAVAGGHLTAEVVRMLEERRLPDIEWVRTLRALVPRSPAQRAMSALVPDEAMVGRLQFGFRLVDSRLASAAVVDEVMAVVERAGRRFEPDDRRQLERWLHGLDPADRLALGERFQGGRITMDTLEALFTEGALRDPGSWFDFLMGRVAA